MSLALYLLKMNESDLIICSML